MDSYVIVTGFGPFDCHKINASWEAVKLLPETIDDCRIIKEVLPVCYSSASAKVKNLWNEYQPKLAIHVGVSDLARKMTLEMCAHRHGYDAMDIFGRCPENEAACAANCDDALIVVGLDLKMICDRINAEHKVKACLSRYAGKYLCEYVYYISLSFNKDRAIFIHVPPLDKPYSVEELADGIQEVVKLALKQCN